MSVGTKWYDQPPRPLEDDSDYLFEIHRQTAQIVDEFLDFKKKQTTVNEVLFEDMEELKGRMGKLEADNVEIKATLQLILKKLE